MKVTREQRISVGLAAGAAAAAIFAHSVNPYHATWLPKCPFHLATTLWCPGCGSTRAVCALAQGNVVGAFRHNILFLPALAVLTWAYVVYALCAFFPHLRARSWAIPPLRRWNRFVKLVPAIVIAFWVIRNIPGAPVHLLSS